MATAIETSPDLQPVKAGFERCISPLSQASTGAGSTTFSRTVSQETAPHSSAADLMLPENLDSLRGCLEDGPALTPHGRALDLDGGVAIFFSCSEELSQSHEAKLRAEANARMLRAMRVAHALCEAEAHVDQGEVCSIRPDGTAHGADALEPPPPRRAGGVRSKLYVRKRRAADTRHQPFGADHPGALCPDGEGKVSVYLYLNREADRHDRRQRRLAAKAQRDAQDPEAEVKVLIVDAGGRIRGCRDLCRAPPIIPVC